MEIERKWMVSSWPDKLQPFRIQKMRQGYLVVSPTVRIREEAVDGGKTSYILCLKSGHGLARYETEFDIPEERFHEIEEMIGLPLIPKERHDYRLPDGHVLEVSLVDQGASTEFMYAEIEYESIEEARSWTPDDPELAAYLSHDVTDEPGQTMGAYWIRTRVGECGAAAQE